MISANRTVLAVTLALAMGFGLSLLNGCSGGGGYEGEERAAVSGTVTLDGSPLPYGTISFVPADEGRRANAAISDGSYSIPEEQGPNLGEYKVEILGFDKPPEGDEEGEEHEGEEEEDDGAMDDDDEEGGPGRPGEKPMVPPRYNAETELTALLVSGDNEHNFELESE